MGAGSAAGSGNSNETSTPFGTSKGTTTKTRFGYTKPPKTARETAVDFVKGGGTVGAIIKGVGGAISKKTKEINLARRKKFISKSGLTSDDINMNEKYLSSKEGLAELKAQGYTTASDNSNTGGGSADNEPTIIKKNIGGSTIQTTAPTEAEVSQSETANADAAALKVKKRGRSRSIMTSSKGVTKTASNYSLGKPSLLGQV